MQTILDSEKALDFRTVNLAQPDSCRLCFRLTVADRQSTRSGIPSTIASVFHSLGCLAPFILLGTQILQQMCRDECSWDDPLSDPLMPRIHLIKDLSSIEDWFLVPSSENPANHASRGLSASELKESNWFSGPSFLWRTELIFPMQIQNTLSSDDPEIKKLRVNAAQTEEDPGILQRLATWHSVISTDMKLRYCKDVSISLHAVNLIGLENDYSDVVLQNNKWIFPQDARLTLSATVCFVSRRTGPSKHELHNASSMDAKYDASSGEH
ncbi:hypothetical protein CAPTEDRAFT_197228 [Capitella teleta]|uniref:Uncharacterized protein n=1 Tax=Capitella teleta TaxID=283909 RepID=R7V0S2_CAPTE|nr:hypothetical protein CAPTEDRAFT_197228 [Capitella teleta]|eukprot:ELU12097.1 hypothetical protein CAPTEDRAFT_197228 [Capitella teleta]